MDSVVARDYAKNLQPNQGQATIKPWRHPGEDSFQQQLARSNVDAAPMMAADAFIGIKVFPALANLWGAIRATGANIWAGKTVITSEMADKILLGKRVIEADGKITNRLIGAHSGEISNLHPKYAVEDLLSNPDGTRYVKLLTQFDDGKLSKIKTSTLFPDNWTSKQTLDAIKQVGNSPPLAIRVDGASLHQSSVNGVKIEVIKVGENVVSGYPAGHKGFQTTTKFLNASN